MARQRAWRKINYKRWTLESAIDGTGSGWHDLRILVWREPVYLEVQYPAEQRQKFDDGCTLSINISCQEVASMP